MERILIVKRGAMGDILMATPFLRQLHKIFPNAQIDFITSKSYAEVLVNNTNIFEIIMLNDAFFRIKNILGAIKYFLALRNKYDYVFALDKHYYFNFLVSLVGGISVGFLRENISRLFLTKFVTYHDINCYHALYYLDLLKALGHQPNYNDLDLDLFAKPTIRHSGLEYVL